MSTLHGKWYAQSKFTIERCETEELRWTLTCKPRNLIVRKLFTFEQMGTASALDTVCGQSYGAKMYGMLGIQMQRAMLVLTLFSIPLSIVWANTEHFLVFFCQDKSIAHLSGSYARFMIPSIFAYGLLQCLNRFLQAQNNVFPVVVCSGVTTSLHVIICWALVLKSCLGFRGAAVANAVSYWLNVILLSYVLRQVFVFLLIDLDWFL